MLEENRNKPHVEEEDKEKEIKEKKTKTGFIIFIIILVIIIVVSLVVIFSLDFSSGNNGCNDGSGTCPINFRFLKDLLY